MCLYRAEHVEGSADAAIRRRGVSYLWQWGENDFMSRKRAWTVAACILAAIALCGLGLWIWPGLLHHRHDPSPLVSSRAAMVAVAQAVQGFYKERDTSDEDDMNAACAKWMLELRDMFSTEPPVESYTHPMDLSVYLLLPERLHSPQPMLIAFSQPVEQDDGTLCRQTIFLCGSKLVALPLDEQKIRLLVGQEQLATARPDIYFWRWRRRYLEDTKKGTLRH